MKTSPIQLLDSTILLVNVEHSDDSRFEVDEHNPTKWDKVAIKTSRSFVDAKDYWTDRDIPVDGIDSRTFAVQLGIKSDLVDSLEWSPYKFEIVIGVLVAVVKDGEPAHIKKMAYQYGLQFAFGSIREVLLNLTSRMQHGSMLLPTMSFMDEVVPESSEKAQGGDIGALGASTV